MTLQNWEPFTGLRELGQVMDRALNRNPFLSAHSSENWFIPLDISQTGTQFTVSASLPGVAADEIELTIEDGVLSISGAIGDTTAEDAKFLMRERAHGRLHREVRLPDSIDVDGIESAYSDGVLTITVPKSESKQKRKIAVGNFEPSKVIEAKAS